jgi:hypothetical protein
MKGLTLIRRLKNINMQLSGTLSKMTTELASPVHYRLPVGQELLDMNDLLGHEISLTWLNEIHCLNCGRITKKSFGQGYCYPCFISIPETEDCVLHPELCRAHEGIARDMEWAREHCLQDHFVYLALSSDVKVGVTRKSQIPTRWIDQGASQAIKLAKTPNRYLAGLIEVELKKHLTDKTNWRNMLMNKTIENISLVEEKKRIAALLPPEMTNYYSNDDTIVELTYPSLSIPQKVTSIDLEKQPTIVGTLNGIKGQYLIFDDGKVINIRKYGGYLVEVKN